MTPAELAARLAELHKESFGWALSCCGWDDPLAEDVLQTAYVRIVSGKARFGGRSSFRTWLFGVIRRVSQEESRRWRRAGTRGFETVPPETLRVESDALARIARDESSRQLIDALNRLPDRQREVLHLVFYEDLTIAEAAKVMGVSLGSARTHYHRGKERMRSLIEEGAIRE